MSGQQNQQIDPTKLHIETANLKGLELLYDYTKFHIGVYLTIAASFITIASLKKGEEFILNLNINFVYGSVGLFMLAGLAGGIIISSITQMYGYAGPWPCASVDEFLNKELGFQYKDTSQTSSTSSSQTSGSSSSQKWFPPSALTWTRIEHYSFWAGIICAFVSFIFAPSNPKPVKEPTEVKVSGSLNVNKDNSLESILYVK